MALIWHSCSSHAAFLPILPTIEGSFIISKLQMVLYLITVLKGLSLDHIFSRILPLAEGQWQDCSVLFCARAQKVQNKGWRTTGKSGSVYY